MNSHKASCVIQQLLLIIVILLLVYNIYISQLLVIACLVHKANLKTFENLLPKFVMAQRECLSRLSKVITQLI